ncbi:histidine--tRNA ligase [Candidatus Wolfebacteria bacterium]|nr:histidine--tRNA ligase [Candidatus Wolfebacteria bacterium]
MPKSSKSKIKKTSKGKVKNVKSKKEKKTFQSPKGMRDILPSEQSQWEKLRKTVIETANFYNFSRIDTPILEDVEIFKRGTGIYTDIVEKQMFVLKTKGRDYLALRPENTPGIVRAYFENGLSRFAQPIKLYYFGPFFRYEQPQFGRYRQFHQVGFEILGGEDNPIYDAQAILTLFRLIEDLKIKNLTIQINSLGCKNCRTAYTKKLQEYYRKFSSKICKDCRRRISLNPLRLLDCKNENCKEIKEQAPTIIDFLCSSCRSHFRGVLEYLDELELPYVLNPCLVRGLDYYNRTVFEITAEGYDLSLGGGGRFDYLGELITGKKNSFRAVGSSLGVERIIELMNAKEIKGLTVPKAKVFLIQIGKPAKKRAFSLIEEFRNAGIKVVESLGKESLKSQLKLADKEKVELALILGQKEFFEESIIIRDMKSGVQETAPLNKVIDIVKRKLKKKTK